MHCQSSNSSEKINKTNIVQSILHGVCIWSICCRWKYIHIWCQDIERRHAIALAHTYKHMHVHPYEDNRMPIIGPRMCANDNTIDCVSMYVIRMFRKCAVSRGMCYISAARYTIAIPSVGGPIHTYRRTVTADFWLYWCALLNKASIRIVSVQCSVSSSFPAKLRSI